MPDVGRKVFLWKGLPKTQALGKLLALSDHLNVASDQRDSILLNSILLTPNSKIKK